jgi:hypothetical protein
MNARSFVLYAKGVNQFQPRVKPWEEAQFFATLKGSSKLLSQGFRLFHPFKVMRHLFTLYPG